MPRQVVSMSIPPKVNPRLRHASDLMLPIHLPQDTVSRCNPLSTDLSPTVATLNGSHPRGTVLYLVPQFLGPAIASLPPLRAWGRWQRMYASQRRTPHWDNRPFLFLAQVVSKTPALLLQVLEDEPKTNASV